MLVTKCIVDGNLFNILQYILYTVYIYMCTIYFFSSGRHVRMNEVCINFNITSIYIILLGINIL